MDVSFVIAQQSVLFVVSQITNLGSTTTAMIYNFTGVSTTLTNAGFSGKTLNDIAVIANGTELDTLNECSISGTTITLNTSLEGTGRAKVIVV